MTKLKLLALIFLVSCNWNEKADKTNEIASDIISKLEDYKNEFGTYPDSLKLLVPDYFTKIPSTFYSGRNNEFYYAKHIFTRDSSRMEFFELWFNAPLGVEAKYNSFKKEWQYDD